MVSDHSDRERKNPLPPHGLLFPISSKCSFIDTFYPIDRITHTMVFVTPIVEHWLEREIGIWVHHEGSLLPWSYILLPGHWAAVSLKLYLYNFIWIGLGSHLSIQRRSIGRYLPLIIIITNKIMLMLKVSA